MSNSDTVVPSGLGWGESRRSLSSIQVGSSFESEDWIRLVTVCCKLDIPILNPPPLSIKTRSGRGKNSGIARQIPTDFRGRNAVLKSCRINKDRPLQYDFRSIIQEILVFAHPRLQAHRNIARLLGVMWEEDSLGLNLGIAPVLVLDYADMGTLTELVERKPSLTFLEKIYISLGVGEAIEALHDCNIIHGDLKSENVLIQTSEDGKFVPKLTDFDLSLLEPPSATKLPGRTFPWNAPEYYDLLCTDCLKMTDVFSFGMLIWRIFCDGTSPFEYLDDVDLDDEESIEFLKSDPTFLDKAHQSLQVLALQDIECYVIEQVLKSTLPSDPAARSLKSTLSALRGYARQGTDQPQEVKSTWDPLLSAYEDVIYDHEDLEIDFEHMRYTDPKFNTHLVDQLELASSVSDRPQRQAEALLHLSIAFFNGFGVQRDVGFALGILIRSAQGGCIRAQALVKRVHDSLRTDCPSELPLSAWLVAATETGSVIAAQDLKMYFPDAYPAAIQTFRTAYGGLGRPLNLPERGKEARFYYDGLHLMAMQGNLMEVLKNISTDEILVEINAQNYWGETPVLCACRSGHTRVVEALLERGADPSINSRSGEGPLHWLSSFPDDDIPRVGELLLDAGAALDCHSSRNVFIYPHLFNGLEAGTPLLRAVARRNRLAINWLLSKGALPSHNIYESNPNLVQRKSAYLGGEWIGSKGLRGNADFTLRQKRSSPLIYACMSHFSDIAPLLLDAESQDLLNCNSIVPQTYGLWGRFRDSTYVKTLSWTADSTTNAFDSDAFDRLNAVFPEFTLLFYTCLGNTLFHLVSLHGVETRDQMVNMISVLVGKGASLSRVNKLDATALHAAVEGGNTDIAEFLLMDDGICRNHINTCYKGFLNLRPLHMAIIQDNEEMFRMLLRHEAEVAYGIEACSLASHENMYFIHELEMRGGIPVPFGSRAPPLPLALLRRHFALADFIIENWPKQLELTITAGFNILNLITLTVCLSGQTDVRPLTHLIGHLRQRNLVLCGPSNYYKGDIFVLAIVSSWGQKKVEVLDEDWEHCQATKAVFAVLLKEYGHHESVDLAKAVHFAAQGRNLTALKMLLEFGADPNYISDMLGMKIGLSALDFALRDLNGAVPAKVKQAGDRAIAKYKARSEEIVNILRMYGAQTVFDLKGYGVYGERVGAFIGYVVTFKCLVDILDWVLNFREDATIWGRKKRTWINNNLPYF